MVGSAVSADLGLELVLQNTVLSDNVQGEAVYGPDDLALTVTCCDIWGNAGGDWVGPLGSKLGIDGNISADPLFCDPVHRDFALDAESPCAPEQNPECGQIGAWPVGCGASTPVCESTWGAIKALYQRE